MWSECGEHTRGKREVTPLPEYWVPAPDVSSPDLVNPSVCSSWVSLSHVWLLVTPETVAHQASLPMEFSRQEYWSGLSFPSLRDLPHPGMQPRNPALQADSLPSEPPGKPHLLGNTRLKKWVYSLAGNKQNPPHTQSRDGQASRRHLLCVDSMPAVTGTPCLTIQEWQANLGQNFMTIYAEEPS